MSYWKPLQIKDNIEIKWHTYPHMQELFLSDSDYQAWAFVIIIGKYNSL